MALKIEEFDVNYITAVGGKFVNRLKFTNFRYKNSNAQSAGFAHGPEGPGLRPISSANYRLWRNQSGAREIWKLL